MTLKNIQQQWAQLIFAENQNISSERLLFYRDAIFSTFEQTLNNTYPITQQLLGNQAWQQLTRSFMAGFGAKNNILKFLPQDFYHFFDCNQAKLPLDQFPFLLELLNYELAELLLLVKPNAGEQLFSSQSLKPESKIIFNRDLEIKLYQYPVHFIDPNDPAKVYPEGEYYLALWRDYTHQEVHFMELNQGIYEWWQQYQQTGLIQTFTAITEQFALEMPDEYREVFREQFAIFVQEAVTKQLLIQF